MRYLLATILLFATGCIREPGPEVTKNPEALLEDASPNAHTITLRPDKKIEMNGEVHDAEEIATMLQKSKEKKDSVILKVDYNTKANDVLKAVDEIKRIGFERIYVSTFKENK